MTELAREAAIEAAELLTHYSFDLGGYTVEWLIDYWLREYPANWLRSALVEALYQGRYKAVSVTQILMLWKRRGQPLYHFNHEFERMICGKFPRNLIAPAESARTTPKSDRPSPASPLETDPAIKQDLRDIQAAEEKSAEKSDDSTLEQPAEASDLSGDRPIRALLPAAQPTTPPPTDSVEVIPSSTAIPPEVEPESFIDAEPSKPSAYMTKSPSDQPPASEGTAEALTTESPIQTFRPVTFGLDTAELAQWRGDRVSKHPIHQFVPTTGVSSFYAKLKAVIQNRDSEHFADFALAGEGNPVQEQRDRD